MRDSKVNQPSHRLALGFGAAVVVLGVAGFGHRILGRQVDALLNEYLKPKQPLASIPLQLGSWSGKDIPMDEPTRKIAGDDDFINREYDNPSAGRGASLYVGYIGRPRSRMGHRPDVCYPAHGFREVSRQTTEVRVEGMPPVPALLFEYAPPGIGGSPLLVLATFVINGTWVNDTASANAYNVRGPALFSRQTAYVARMQVSMPCSGDQAADLAALTAFTSQTIAQVESLLP